MKLADTTPIMAVNYARLNKYSIVEIFTEEESTIPNVLRMINLVLRDAYNKGCTEFCFKEIRNKYNIMDDSHHWSVSIFGFIPKKDS